MEMSAYAIELLTPLYQGGFRTEVKDKKRKQIGILGGNFNPVHNAHLVVADQVRHSWAWIRFSHQPEYVPPHVDKKETIDEQHRLKMLELAIEGIEGLGIETIELERKEFLTLRHHEATDRTASRYGLLFIIVRIWWTNTTQVVSD